ncbi:MAG: 2OG-Fe(II) oxygenase [Sphingomonas bacterium]|nr:alpha-ketoglutarate-dependent dioxygenase AlkB [Sphingomonas bacterium]MDB5689783.1 2OG-Fe(II) oxygenase [Sphingomonas bacterium]
MIHQDDLFDAPLVPGLDYRDDVITAAEEQDLIDRIAEVPVSPFRFQGWEGKRQTASFGWHYDFADASFAPTTPIPEFLLTLRDRAAAFAALPAADLVQVLVTRYDPGAGIGWHRDRPVFEHVVGVSLGAPATLRLRRRSGSRFERVSLPVAPRSIYHLSGAARHQWEHSIAAMEVRRWSITFRSMSAGMAGIARPGSGRATE